ncbi:MULTISPECIES: hypothetical protein [Bacillus]|uniref:Uncharacterized protein n=1 Tax=Bacillus cereus TaxID=1396 RepID=A0A164N8P0_BACCE|nr:MULTISPECIES: hypothetical protein [Bacillus]KZD62903.1 hypothetical protein B4088_3512 [Bacillus cereus]NEK98430.1 hypothetical protein [Bacillus mobilis]
MSEYIQTPLRLHKEKDKDIIEFLEEKPKNWIMKEALRMYAKQYSQMSKKIESDDYSDK